METLTRYLAVAAGGALGAMARYYLSGSALARAAAPFPTATFVINVTGSFILGLFLTLATERINVSPHLRLAVAVGFVGAYTTFSTFEYETARLIEERGYVMAFLYVVLSFVVGLAAVWGGIVTARKLEGWPVMSGASRPGLKQQASAGDPPQRSATGRENTARVADESQRGEAPYTERR